MPIDRLPETIQAVYAELLDQTILAEAERVARHLPAPGTFVSKEIKGGRYWYLQRVEAGRKRQYYLGPESDALARWMSEVVAHRQTSVADERRRSELVGMLLAGGATGEVTSVGRVIQVLAESGVFRLGGVLVGTQAFHCYSNVLGVRFRAVAQRTQDVDVAQDRSIPVALDAGTLPSPLQELLESADPAFLAVPSLDPREPSTAFKVRGRDLRVDLLTPWRTGDGEGPVQLPYLKAAAQPLPFLDYLLTDVRQAVVLVGAGALVRVPDPGRFVFHKLWLSRQRPATYQTKARKDLRQAQEVARVLLEDRPRDLDRARETLEPARRKAIADAVGQLPDDLRSPLSP